MKFMFEYDDTNGTSAGNSVIVSVNGIPVGLIQSITIRCDSKDEPPKIEVIIPSSDFTETKKAVMGVRALLEQVPGLVAIEEKFGE